MSVVASLLGVAGMFGVAFGFWEMFEPVGYVVAGVELVYLSWRLT